jgi:hypothetical protein
VRSHHTYKLNGVPVRLPIRVGKRLKIVVLR